MVNSKVVGQEHIVKHFENAIIMGKISHAYIINGEAGSGKSELAAAFAKALQCHENGEEDVNKTGKACGECKSCHQSDSKNQPDIRWITYEKSGIGVDEIRSQVNDDIAIKPYSSRYKIYIVPDCEKMTEQAQNALLKTIEEPPKYGIIILLTTNADKFLQTILSRCVLLNIRPVNDEIIKKQLILQWSIGEYDASVASAFAEGNYGKAVKLATSDEFKGLKTTVVNSLVSLENGGMDIVNECVKNTSEFKNEIEEYFNLMRIWYRDILFYKATNESDMLIFQDEYMNIKNQSEKLSYNNINNILKELDNANSRITSNVNFEATLEVLFLAIRERIKR